MKSNLALIIALIVWIAQSAAAAPIYVVKNKDGTITFTTRTPAAGTKAEVFTGKGNLYSRYSGRTRYSWHVGKLHREKYNIMIKAAAKRYSVDASLVKAVIHAESAFNPHAKSPKGAMGLMQLMPMTARELGVQNAYDPNQNILGGTKYLSRLLQKYSGDLKLGLAAYNAGPEAVAEYGGVPPYSETRTYVARVLRLFKEYQKVAS